MSEYIGTIVCALLAVFTFLMFLVFILFKGKAARFISGFSSYSSEERKFYDVNKMSKDMAILYLKLTLVMILGIFVSFINQWLVWIAILIWGILFFKNVSLDDEKAFGKYRKKDMV